MKKQPFSRIGLILVWVIAIDLWTKADAATWFDDLTVAVTDARGPQFNLLDQYPTALIAGDTQPANARSWECTKSDLYRLSGWQFQVEDALRVEIGPADLGIGHCADGAVWAVVIPRAEGTISSPATAPDESIRHLWLRFHPRMISSLFPPDTVSAPGEPNLLAQMLLIARTKMGSSWQAGGLAMIPGPKDVTVDADTQGGPRRFFMVDTQAKTAQYVNAFEKRAMKMPTAITPASAEAAFDQLWEAFDREYAMFALRPEVDWTQLRDQYRPRAVQSKSTAEFAETCAEMLRSLRDLHIWMTVSGVNVPIYHRPRPANANPQAYRVLLGKLNRNPSRLEWAITAEGIGFIAIRQWNHPQIPDDFNEVLDQMRSTRGLIIDVRLNGGGSEPLARKVAGRFLKREVIYSYSQYRNGPKHTDLTSRFERKAGPDDLWRYDRPVLLLIGQRCMSSNESFIAMMAEAPQVTTLGDRTAGSSGNPKIINLPLDMTVSVPQWIDYLADATPLDEKGITPRVRFESQTDSFQGTRDDLLSAAIKRLQAVPRPEQPISTQTSVEN